MAFDLTQRPFEQMIREHEASLDKGITVKPEDLYIDKKYIEGIRRGKIPIPPKKRSAKKNGIPSGN